MKRCAHCGEVKPIGGFYASTGGGAQGYCKTCSREMRREWARAYRIRTGVRYKPDHEEELRLRRLNTERHPDALRVRRNRWRVANPERAALINRARLGVRRALRKGTLIRAETCEICGATGVSIEAAHRDYSNYLDVRWLCRPCHRRWDYESPKSTPNPHSVL